MKTLNRNEGEALSESMAYEECVADDGIERCGECGQIKDTAENEKLMTSHHRNDFDGFCECREAIENG